MPALALAVVCEVALDEEEEDPAGWLVAAVGAVEVAGAAEAGGGSAAAAAAGGLALPVAEFSSVPLPASVPTGAKTLGVAGAAAGVDAGCEVVLVPPFELLLASEGSSPVETISAPTPVVGASVTSDGGSALIGTASPEEVSELPAAAGAAAAVNTGPGALRFSTSVAEMASFGGFRFGCPTRDASTMSGRESNISFGHRMANIWWCFFSNS